MDLTVTDVLFYERWLESLDLVLESMNFSGVHLRNKYCHVKGIGMIIGELKRFVVVNMVLGRAKKQEITC